MKLEIYGANGIFSAHGEYDPGVDPMLEACPFCGSAEALVVENTHTPSYAIMCKCGAEMHGPCTYDHHIRSMARCRTLHKQAFRAAIEAWNTRATRAKQRRVA